MSSCYLFFCAFHFSKLKFSLHKNGQILNHLMSFGQQYTNKILASIKIHNTANTSWIPFYICQVIISLSFLPPEAHTNFHQHRLVCSYSLAWYNWNSIMYAFFCVVILTQYSVSEIHPCLGGCKAINFYW